MSRPAESVMDEGLTDLIEREPSLPAFFQKIKVVAEDKEKTLAFLQDLMGFFRRELLDKIGIGNENRRTQISSNLLRKFLLAAQKTDYLLRRTNVNTRLAMENLILNLF